MAYLEARNIKKKYPDFDLDISLTMEKGELVCILGPSGSGKSTLLSLLSGVEEIDEGEVYLSGNNITSLSIEKRGIGFVYQDFSLFTSMNVEKNIEYGMKSRKRAERKKTTESLLSLVGLSGYEKRSVETLSGGEAQRVALIRAIAAESEVLFLDEPLASLDLRLRKNLRSRIRQIHDSLGLSMLYVTHDRDEAFAIADRIIIMKDGRIDTSGTPEEIYAHPKTLFSAFFTGDGTALDSSLLGGIDGGGTLFFRPESVSAISEEPLNTGIYPNHVIFNDCTVESIEYRGDGYMVLLLFKGNPIMAFTRIKPRRKTVSLLILKDSIQKI